jgi:hypothetical protein
LHTSDLSLHTITWSPHPASDKYFARPTISTPTHWRCRTVAEVYELNAAIAQDDTDCWATSSVEPMRALWPVQLHPAPSLARDVGVHRRSYRRLSAQPTDRSLKGAPWRGSIAPVKGTADALEQLSVAACLLTRVLDGRAIRSSRQQAVLQLFVGVELVHQHPTDNE